MSTRGFRTLNAPNREALLDVVASEEGSPEERSRTGFDNVWRLPGERLLFVGEFPHGRSPRQERSSASAPEPAAWGIVLPRWSESQLSGRGALVPEVDFYQDHDGLLYRAALSYGLDLPLAVHGHTGTGKTELIRYLAHLLGAPLYRMNLHGLSTTDDIIGKLLPAGRGEVRFQDGLVTAAVRNGGVLLLEEMNATGQEVWFSLHGLLDQSRALVLVEKDNEVVHQHPDCRIFATFNPSEYLTLYPGTKELSAAYLRRWSSVRLDFMPVDLERRILLERHPELGFEEHSVDLEAMLEVARLSREMLAARPNAFPFVFSTGVLQAWAALSLHLGPLQAARMTFYDLADERLQAVFREQVFAYATPWDLGPLE